LIQKLYKEYQSRETTALIDSPKKIQGTDCRRFVDVREFCWAVEKMPSFNLFLLKETISLTLTQTSVKASDFNNSSQLLPRWTETIFYIARLK
jgi:hypothetical protein